MSPTVLPIALLLAAQGALGPTQQQLQAASRTPDWLLADGDYGGTRFSPAGLLDQSSVRRIRPLCHVELGDAPAFQSNPIVHDGVVYVTTTTLTLAFRGSDCTVLWRHARTPRDSANYPPQRGVALKDGIVVRGTSDGYLLALDARDGRVLWERGVADAASGAAITMPLTPFRDVVLAGAAGGEFGARGWIGAFNLRTGEPVWRFNTVPPRDSARAPTWGPPDAIAGGGVWTAVAIDAARNELFVPVGSPAPPFDGSRRPGANLYTSGAVVLDVRNGRLLWHRQQVPHDVRNWDLTHARPLYETRIRGRARRVAIMVGKAGLLEAVDRASREVLFSTALVHRDTSAARVCPGPFGGVAYNGPAYSPSTNTLYVPAIEWCATIHPRRGEPLVARRFNWGARFEMEPAQRARGWLVAVDAATGEVRWRYASRRPMIAAVTVTAGNIVLAGELTGDLIALDARTGEPLYRHNVGAPIGGGIVTYTSGGRQFVAVASGNVSGFWDAQGGPARVTLFGIPQP